MINGENKIEVEQDREKDVRKLVKYYREWSKSGKFYKNKRRAASQGVGAWGSNDGDRIKLKLGTDKDIYNKRNVNILKELGYLDSKGEWVKPTVADKEFEKKDLQEKRDSRLNLINELKKRDDNWLAPGRKVQDRLGELGEIEKVTRDGYVVINGEKYDPKHLYKVKPPKPVPGSNNNSKRNDQLEVLDPFPENMEFKGKSIELGYKNGNGVRAKNRKVGVPISSREQLKDTLIKILAKETQKGGTQKPLLTNLDKIVVDGADYFAGYEKQGEYYSFGGIHITKDEIAEYIIESTPNDQKSSIGDSFTINVNRLGGGKTPGTDQEVEYLATLHDEITTGVDYTPGIFLGQISSLNQVIDMATGKPQPAYGGLAEDEVSMVASFRSLISQRSKTKAIGIFGHPQTGEIRLMTLRLDSTGRVEAFDSTFKASKTKQYKRLIDMQSKGWSLQGKFGTNDIAKDIDILYTGIDAFSRDPKILDAVNNLQEGIAQAEEQAVQANRNKIKDLEKKKADLVKAKAKAKAEAAKKAKETPKKTAKTTKKSKAKETETPAPSSEPSKIEQLLARQAELAQKDQEISSTIADLARRLRSEDQGAKAKGTPEKDDKSELRAIYQKLLKEQKALREEQDALNAEIEKLLDEEQKAPGESKIDEEIAVVEQEISRAYDVEAAQQKKKSKAETTEARTGQVSIQRDGGTEDGGAGFDLKDQSGTRGASKVTTGKSSSGTTVVNQTKQTAQKSALRSITQLSRGDFGRLLLDVGLYEDYLNSLDYAAGGIKNYADIDVTKLQVNRVPPKTFTDRRGKKVLSLEELLKTAYERGVAENRIKPFYKGKAVAGQKREIQRELTDDQLATLARMVFKHVKAAPDIVANYKMKQDEAQGIELERAEPEKKEESGVVPKLVKFLQEYEVPISSSQIEDITGGDLSFTVNRDTMMDDVAFEISDILEIAEQDEFVTDFKNSFSKEEITELVDPKGTERIRVAEEPQGLEIKEPYQLDESRLNDGEARLDNMIDPQTGKVIWRNHAPIDVDSIEKSISEARRLLKQAQAPEQNPLITMGREDRVTEGMAAIRRFSPDLKGGRAQTAINQIIDQFPNLAGVGPVARMISGSKFLQDYNVEFMEWKDYRQYASVNGVVTQAVHMPSQKRIIISDAFWNPSDPLTADESLAANIVHELLHPVIQPAIDIGHAMAHGNDFDIDPSVLNTSKEALEKIYTDVNDTLLPYLREQSKGNLDLRYGLSSIDEFFNVFASDAQFREFLANTQLPQSMRRKGIMQTVLDFIYHLLAKLNFPVAKTDSAMKYATEQLDILIRESGAIGADIDNYGEPQGNQMRKFMDKYGSSRFKNQSVEATNIGFRNAQIKYDDEFFEDYPHDTSLDIVATINGETKVIGNITGNANDVWNTEKGKDEYEFHIVGGHINEEFRGKGNYKKALRALLDRYDKVHSHTSLTSAAEGAWKSIGGKAETDRYGYTTYSISNTAQGNAIKGLTPDEKKHLENKLDPKATYDKDTILFYDETLQEISRRATPGSQEYDIIRAINVARTGEAGSGAGLGIQKTKTITNAQGLERLRRFAIESGKTVDRAEFDDQLDWGEIMSGEHRVHYDDQNNRYFKEYVTYRTSGNIQGENRLADQTLDTYLERLLVHNYLFPEVAYQFEGLIEERDGQSLNPVVSQEGFGESNPPPAMINEYMISKGFRLVPELGFSRIEKQIPSEGNPIFRKFSYGGYQRGDIVVRDLGERNAKVVDGTLYPFDPLVEIGFKQSIERLQAQLDLIEKSVKETKGYRGLSKAQLLEQVNLIVSEIKDLRRRGEQENAQGNAIKEQLGSPNPDDNARVMMEANAAGFNEMETELIKVYNEVGNKTGMELKEFLDYYGKPGRDNLSTIRKRLDKDLKPFMETSENVRISDAGLNRIARNWGIRKAIANLEKVRTKARKKLAALSFLEERHEKSIIDSKQLYEDLLNGRFPPTGKQVDHILKKVQAVNFDKLSEYVKALPKSGMTQDNIKSLRNISKADLDGIIESLVNMPGVIEDQSKQELYDAIEVSNDTTGIKRMAIMYAIKESRANMALYRLSKGKIGEDQKQILDVAQAIVKARKPEQIDAISIQKGIKGTPLRQFAKMRKQELEAQESIGKTRAEMDTYKAINEKLFARSSRLRVALGELQPVNIFDGATILTMEWDDKEAEWKRGEDFKVQIKNGKIVDRPKFVKVNRETLRFVNDPEMQKKYGQEPWFDIMKEQALLAMSEPIGEEYFHVQRASWMTGLQGLTERFSKLGYEGMKLAQMSSRTVALFRDYSSKSQALSLQFNASAQRLMSSLKLSGREFYSGLYQDIWWWFDNHPEYAGNEEKAFAMLWKHLRENANIPDKSLLTEDARRLTKDMIAKTLAARDYETQINRQLGNRIRDDEFQVESFVDGELTDFYRLPLDIGYATMPRSINDSLVETTVERMESLGWRGETGKGLIEEAAKTTSLEDMEKIYKSLFTEEVVERFVEPYTNTDVRQSMFRGPAEEDGHQSFIGNTFIREAYNMSKGDIYLMSDIIFDRLAEDPTDRARIEWKYSFLKQIDSRFGQLKKVRDNIVGKKVGQGLHDPKLMRNTPQSLDSRMMESRLPKEFFYYTMFDEVTSNIRLALSVATSTFGRSGDQAQQAFEGGRDTYRQARSDFNTLMEKVVEGKHQEPRRHYSRAEKRDAYKELRRQGETDPEKKFNEMYGKAVALGELERAMEHLARYYGKDNAAGPYKDANLLLELLGVQSLAVLNNPKSSFWQNLGLFEFPMAFRGLNKMAGKGTATALGNFVNQTFGGMVEAFGFEMDKAGRYSQYLNNTHFRLDEMEVGFKDYVTAQLGSGGDLAGYNPKKYLRMVKRAMMHSKAKKGGTRAPFDFLTTVKGIFPYINNVVNHSIGVGAINAYSDLVLQVAKEIETRGITEFKEFTPEELGMGDKMGEWIIGEKDGYLRMNELLISHGLPTVSRLAFDFIDRKKIEKNAFPIEKNTALLINTIAMDQISGDGFNAKPAWLYSNEYLRYFNTFLGWPLGKMGRDLSAVIRDSEDPTTTYMALLKYVGLLSAVYMPLSLSFAMMIDWYDEEMLEKPNNLPPISPWAALPVIGIPLAMQDPNFSIYSVTSRIAKAGVPFGMGGELVNGMFAKGDPYGAARDLSLDSRIFIFGMFKNIYDAIGTWVHQGEWDWETVGRPIAYGVGGNSVIQMIDLATAQMDIDSEERRVADYIGIKNTIKKTAFMMGLELRPPFKGGGRPSKMSINTRQMARAAYAGDSDTFLREYQEALAAAREAGKEDPERDVITSYKSRDIRTGITRTKLSDYEWQLILSALDEEDRLRVQRAVASHEHYLRMIGGSYRAESPRRIYDSMEARRIAASLF